MQMRMSDQLAVHSKNSCIIITLQWVEEVKPHRAAKQSSSLLMELYDTIPHLRLLSCRYMRGKFAETVGKR